jgi:cytochrome c oxidase subunit II
MSVSAATSADGGTPEPRHALRIIVIWAVLSVIGVLLVVLVAGPHIPPFHGSVQARDQHRVNVILTAIATPVAMMIWVYFGYSAAVFRQRGDTIEDGPPLHVDARVQISWLVVTAVMVLGLAVYGTVGLLGSSSGAGGGQGPSPLAKPADAGKALEVQVIGQQWLWTFRYPGYGGVETAELAVPVGREIAFHVTSLDVIHSFWAYELGVKADAVPGNDNVAFTTPLKTGSIQVRCAELCGLWHGHMNTTGHVMSQAAFAAWIAQQQQSYAGVTKDLPPYKHYYFPDPQRRAG